VTGDLYIVPDFKRINHFINAAFIDLDHLTAIPADNMGMVAVLRHDDVVWRAPVQVGRADDPQLGQQVQGAEYAGSTDWAFRLSGFFDYIGRGQMVTCLAKDLQEVSPGGGNLVTGCTETIKCVFEELLVICWFAHSPDPLGHPSRLGGIIRQEDNLLRINMIHQNFGPGEGGLQRDALVDDNISGRVESLFGEEIFGSIGKAESPGVAVRHVHQRPVGAPLIHQVVLFTNTPVRTRQDCGLAYWKKLRIKGTTINRTINTAKTAKMTWLVDLRGFVSTFLTGVGPFFLDLAI
jgi:hypothetical protein